MNHDEEISLQAQEMHALGITTETHITFHFQGYTYRRLEDAMSYAKSKLDERPDTEAALPQSVEP